MAVCSCDQGGLQEDAGVNGHADKERLPCQCLPGEDGVNELTGYKIEQSSLEECERGTMS
jgi:hypothetical protein